VSGSAAARVVAIDESATAIASVVAIMFFVSDLVMDISSVVDAPSACLVPAGGTSSMKVNFYAVSVKRRRYCLMRVN
jgi:hypothetical protein